MNVFRVAFFQSKVPQCDLKSIQIRLHVSDFGTFM